MRASEEDARPPRPEGTRPTLTGTMTFHAWIEFDGVVLNDRPDVRQLYATFDRPILPHDPVWR
jgi:hypothetical protein